MGKAQSKVREPICQFDWLIVISLALLTQPWKISQEGSYFLLLFCFVLCLDLYDHAAHTQLTNENAQFF